jgi:oxalate decarboxylase/phosphoglucose isomerase-like protein (cupin superfamily)
MTLERVRRVPGRRHEDGRGYLHVAFPHDVLASGGPFGEVYLVRARRDGDRRGDHLHRAMDEWFAVVEGVADLELRDPETGTSRVLRLTPEPPVAVFVPRGIAHCLVQVGPEPLLAVALPSAPHDPSDVFPAATR